MKYFRYFETKAEMDNFDSELPNWLIANRETKGAQLKIKAVGVENIKVHPDPVLWDTTSVEVSYMLILNDGSKLNRSKTVEIQKNESTSPVTRNIEITDFKYTFEVEFEQGYFDYSSIAMYFENVDTKDVTIGVKKSGSYAYTAKLETSEDGVNWIDWGSTSETALTKSVGVGGRLYVRATTNVGYFNNNYIYNSFTSDGKVNVGGNIMSLGYKDFEDNTSITKSYGYNYVFYNMTNLADASKLVLPATTLSDYCYSFMFSGCTSLTAAPELPAKTLTINCYQQMFNGCTSLTEAPALPATTLSYYCYDSMFYNCTSLTEAPELPAETLANFCYQYMFQGCTSLTDAPELPATTMTISCYGGMFNGCTSLTTAPALPATTLASSCYYSMFQGCSKLTSVPELPAETLLYGCYYYMFKNCSKLNHIKALFTTTPSTSYTNDWVSGVASTGTFVKSSAAAWDVKGDYGIPNGWTVETATEQE